jgi:hypothetical protein
MEIMKTTVALADWDADIKNTSKRIADAGFGRVVLCVEDKHVLYREENVMEAVDMLQDEGLEVHLDPWGIQGFAGESTSHPMAFYSWLRLAVRTNADAIMLDEPTHHLKLGLEEIFAAVEEYAPHMPLHLAVQPEALSPELHARVDEVSLSAYFFGTAMSRATPTSLEAQVDVWHEDLNGCMDSAWVQLWGIPAGKEWVPACLINLWTDRNVPVNIWAWDAFRTVSSKRADNPDLVWAHTLSALEINAYR